MAPRAPKVTIDSQSPKVTIDSQGPKVTIDSQGPKVTIDSQGPNYIQKPVVVLLLILGLFITML